MNALLATPIVGTQPAVNSDAAPSGTPGAIQASSTSLQASLLANRRRRHRALRGSRRARSSRNRFDASRHARGRRRAGRYHPRRGLLGPGHRLVRARAVGREALARRAPERRLGAKITRLSGNLEPRTRTELAEIWFDNRVRGIIPGVYLRVEIELKVDPAPLVSNDALITRGGTPFVAVVENDIAHLVRVTTGYSDGKTIQIVSGLTGNETVGMNVPPELIDGSRVSRVNAPPQAAPPP